MVDGKQVKVDNWGIFFLQRLQQFYKKSFFCDLTLQFEDNVQIKVHRLVMNACTEYFQQLENNCESEKNYLLMPSNLPSDVVVPIINFMYSGILEFQESSFDRLYATAKLMNMSVLTKLLDAQKTPLKAITPAPKRIQSVTPITWNLQGKKIMTKSFNENDLPETLPGRKLPIWKRKSAPSSNISFLSANSSTFDTFSSKPYKSVVEEQPRPTRFEWPDEEDSTFEDSFDEISYASKPLILPTTGNKDKSPKPSTSSTFEEIKRTATPVKRPGSPIHGPQSKKVNIQDVKEYLKEHKIRSDFIDYDDSEMADNDLQTYDNDDSNEECSKDADYPQTEESPSKSILKSETSSSTSNKHVRFSLEGKENANTKIQLTPAKIQPKTGQKDNIDMSKHTKIITEVLKKYPHLVKNNKNIRLKILAKGNNTPNTKPTKQQLATAKQTSKVQYMVVKPEQKTYTSDKNHDSGPWECTRCEEPKIFQTYYTYRQHLTEVHNEKQDSQMCNICGHISRKQNMLVYHKYMKHKVQPPAMYNFPQCKVCSYVALSPAMLIKHQLTHSSTDLSCNECGISFPNKQSLITHLSEHNQDKIDPNYHCSYCDMSFISETVLNHHIQNTHEDIKPDIKEIKKEEPEKIKEKIKILSDIKVSTSLPSDKLVPVRTLGDIRTIKENIPVPEPLEPSSEAEALSNVASGIAASLGLVDTIVVLDDQQFILQSTQHGDIQENILTSSAQNYILPDMQMPDLATINTMQDTQPLSENNVITTQTINKAGITSTDELVMVLTDHDYSDAANNTVISDNNIVVLYSHPVQTQATMMINSETGMIEVDKNYTVTSEIQTEQVVNCEESIEMIQQEINNQSEQNEIQFISQEEKMDENISNEYHGDVIVLDDNEQKINENSAIDESIEMIENEINKPETPSNLEITQEIQVHKSPNYENVEYTQEELAEQIQFTDQNTQPAMIITDQNEEIAVETAPENLSENVEKINEETPETTENLDYNLTENAEYTQENIPEVQEIPQMEENIPQIEENIPHTEENITQIEENIPQMEENIPQIAENVPQMEENIPQIEENIPQMDENIPQIEENIPHTEENISQIEETIPQIEENIPQIEKHILVPEETVKVEENIQTEENVNHQEIQIVEDSEVIPHNQEIEEKTPDIKDNSLSREIEITHDTQETNQDFIPSNESSNISQEIEPQENIIADNTQNEYVSESCDSAFETKKTDSKEIDPITNETDAVDTNKNDSIVETEKTIEIKTEYEDKINTQNEKISKLLDDWDDGDTDSQQSFSKSVPSNPNNGNSINKLIDDWEEEEDT